MNKLLLAMLTTLALSSTSIYAQLTENEKKLFESAQKGDFYVVITQDLIKAGTNVNAIDPVTGNAPLHEAYGYRTVAALLLGGAKTTIKNKEGILPIQSALEFYINHTFSDAGIAWEDPNKEGESFNENKALFELLIKDVPDKDFETLIGKFAGYENSKPLEWLLSVKPSTVNIDACYGCFTNKANSTYEPYVTPLLRATLKGYEKNIQMLLNNGADDYIRIDKLRPIEIVGDLVSKGTYYGLQKSYLVLKNFDETGPLRPEGVKEAVALLESGNANPEEYSKLSKAQREAQNNLLFRYAVYSENGKNFIAANIALSILNNRYIDLTDYQQIETTRMGVRVQHTMLKTVKEEFDEAKFMALAKNFLWEDDNVKTTKEVETAELARLCFKKVANICNTVYKNNKGISNLTKFMDKENVMYTDVLDMLSNANGLIDYLYYTALSLPAGKRTAVVAALDLAIELDIRATGGGYWADQKTNIKEFIKTEETLDPKFKSIIGSKEKDLENRIQEIEMKLKFSETL